MIHTVCIFCGSGHAIPDIFIRSAREMGQSVADRNRTLVFGGAGAGLMKALADGALERGGSLKGVMLRSWAEQRTHPDIRHVILADSIAERKRIMLDIGDAFIALPGGFGTLDEFMEVITLAQLGFHHKPCGILNIAGYFDAFLAFLDGMLSSGFIDTGDRNSVITETTPVRLLDAILYRNDKSK